MEAAVSFGLLGEIIHLPNFQNCDRKSGLSLAVCGIAVKFQSDGSHHKEEILSVVSTAAELGT